MTKNDKITDEHSLILFDMYFGSPVQIALGTFCIEESELNGYKLCSTSICQYICDHKELFFSNLYIADVHYELITNHVKAGRINAAGNIYHITNIRRA